MSLSFCSTTSTKINHGYLTGIDEHLKETSEVELSVQFKLLITQTGGLNQLNGLALSFDEKNNSRATESAEQGQTACMCRLILLYTLR